MKGQYRCYVRRVTAPADWEIVGSTTWADEAHAMAQEWEQSSGIVAVRLDVCVRFLEPVAR